MKKIRLIILFYVAAHPGCIASHIVEDIFPDAVRGENSKRRHAFLIVREMEKKKFILRKGRKFYLPIYSPLN